MSRAAVVLRCLRRAGWTNARIEAAVVHDLRVRDGRVLPAAETEFYGEILSAVGVD